MIFVIAIIVVQLVGLAAILAIATWMSTYHGGFAWNLEDPEFNIHPLLMTLGLVFMYGDAILVFRVFRDWSKPVVKLMHAALHTTALICAIIGLVAVFQYHKHEKIIPLYSLHSWCGICTFILFGLQWMTGIVGFLFPKFSVSLRALYKPWHVYFGVFIFAMACATALMGITEKLLFSIGGNYHALPTEALLGNFSGILLIVFGALITFLVTYPPFKRTEDDYAVVNIR